MLADSCSRICRAAAASPRALLDHPLQGRDREGHAGGLQALQVDRGQQLGGRAFRVLPDGAHVQGFQRTQVLALRDRRAGREGVHQVRRGRGDLADVFDAAAADQNRGRALAEIDTAQQGRVTPIVGKEIAKGHRSSLSLAGALDRS
jgi:hypothetical protein